LPEPSGPFLPRFVAFLATLPALHRNALRSVLQALELGAFARYLKPFSQLDDAQASRYVEYLYELSFPTQAMLSSLLFGLKYIYFEDPDVKTFFGYRPDRVPPLEQPPRYVRELMISTRDWPDGEPLEAQVIVIGTGAGGAVVAKELAQRGHAVLMLESGRYWDRRHFVGNHMKMTRKLYRDSGLTFSVGNTPILIPLGHGVGGTTLVNSGTCYRAPDKVLWDWATRLGLRELTPEKMAPYFDRVESILQVETASMRYIGGTARRIAAGAEKLGYKHGPLRRNAPECDGQALCCYGCPTDAKRSTNVSYIPLALKNNAMVLTEAPVDKILVENGRAVGVEALGVREDGSRYRLQARAEVVVVACGSIYTPDLLQRNGLCNSSGELGRNLTIHPAANAFALFDEDLEENFAIPQGYAIEAFHDEGMLYEGASTPLGVSAATINLIGAEFSAVMANARGLANYGFMISETSRGSVVSGEKRPLIAYSLNRYDLDKLQRGLAILARVYFAGGATRVIPNVRGFELMESEADVRRFEERHFNAWDFQFSAFHPLGTARMGHHPSQSVVQHTHETHDVKNLYIVDGSVIPSPLGVNPQVTIMALATRAAEMIAERLS
ncbi:MAG: GMC family oxidoreductase, partial [Myxococcales bacterium]|nr:GMC family oxidoreductase [Myxococcales bacterium]